MTEPTITQIVNHAKSFLRTAVRRGLFEGSERLLTLVGYGVTVLLILSLLPFITLLLLLALVFGLSAWLHLGLGWSALIVAGCLILLISILLLLSKSIMRMVKRLGYQRLGTQLLMLDDNLSGITPHEPLTPSSDSPSNIPPRNVQ